MLTPLSYPGAGKRWGLKRTNKKLHTIRRDFLVVF
jgi:hypothetical protein